ncbi:MAG: biotin--[acetyl-CoA-carboxylase] ligase [Opitutus sp.]|nr:biotin--[acetyl-CoA-carboxylase] ligase [Opitutus sp.]
MAVEFSSAAPCEVTGWAIERHGIVDSTQRLARELPAWSAVIATMQSAGVGQQQRVFVSDPGGLYFTAVVPVLPESGQGRGFSLAVGWAVRAALLKLGIHGVRLRWPNDLTIDARKVGGILIEQASRRTLLVGVGLNVTNQPWCSDPALRGIASSLREGSNALPTEGALLTAVLDAIRWAHEEFERVGLAGMVTRLNTSWGAPHAVELELIHPPQTVRGDFLGVNGRGDLELANGDAPLVIVSAHRVTRLREL